MDSNARIKLANVSDIPVGKSIIASGLSGLEVALFNVDGKIFAIENECPHMGGPLGEGDVEGCIVTCPWHGWQFDLHDGECQNMPGEMARKIEISIENGEIWMH